MLRAACDIDATLAGCALQGPHLLETSHLVMGHSSAADRDALDPRKMLRSPGLPGVVLYFIGRRDDPPLNGPTRKVDLRLPLEPVSAGECDIGEPIILHDSVRPAILVGVLRRGSAEDTACSVPEQHARDEPFGQS